MNPSSALAELNELLLRAYTLESIGALLGWDEQVNLPAGAAEQRAREHAALAEVQQAAASVPRIGELLAELAASPGERDEGARAIVAHARRDFDRATKLPPAFVREKAAQGSRGFQAWARARSNDDFTSYAAVLEANVALARREAGYLGWAHAPYDYALDRHDPGLTAAVVERLFAALKAGLVPLVRTIVRSPAAERARQAKRKLRGFPIDAQRTFLREVTGRIGFDYERGRIDIAPHPFCSGSGSDVRLTTRYKEDEPLAALFGSIHEAGHGMYEQGLPAEHRGNALGLNAGMAVHESQSRLWENQVGRSRGFWRHFEPRWRELFPTQTAALSSAELQLAINAVDLTPIRVEADEVTYNLHIVLRFELEKQLFSGALAVRDLPSAWRAAARELLGLELRSDREGVLQDVHWSDPGMFGYFPSYCLGNMIAAQLWQHLRALRPELEEDFGSGDFNWLLGWLRQQIHAQGRRYSALELVRRTTGEELSPAPLLQYLRERYAGPAA